MASPSRKLAAHLIAALAAGLGATSLLLFGLFLWKGSLGVVHLPMEPSTVLLCDAALCLIFFLQHSGMIRRSFRARLVTIVPAHAHGIVYTIASALALLLLVCCWQPAAAGVYVLEGAPRWFARFVLLLSLAGVIWGMTSLRKFDAFGIDAFLAGPRPGPLLRAQLTVEGPYRRVRHPFYFFGLVALWATPVLSFDRLVLNTLFTVWTVFGAVMEERDLVAQFGTDYKLYQRTVPMLLPRLF